MNVLSSAVVLAVIATVSAKQLCSQYSTNTRDYLNELGEVMKDVYQKIENGKMRYLQELNSNITNAYSTAGCSQWSNRYGETERRQWLYQYLGSFRGNDGQLTPKRIVELVETIEQYLWKVGRDDIFTSCVATKIRDSIMKYLTESCLPQKNIRINFITTGLDDVPVPAYYGKQQYETDLRAAIRLMAAAYLQSTKCGGHSQTTKVIQNINKKTEEDFCWAAADTFVSNQCYADYKAVCPDVIGCFTRMIDNFDTMSEKIFGKKGKIIQDVGSCMRLSNKLWGNKPDDVPTGAEVIKEGLRLWTEVKKVKNDLTAAQQKEAGEYVKTIIKAHFRTEACDCENARR